MIVTKNGLNKELNSTVIQLQEQPALIQYYDIKIKDIVAFGGYDWRVLDVQNGKALLLLELIWDKRKYHILCEDMTWENCTLRKELNDEFYKTIPKADRSRIIKSHITSEKNLWYGTDGGIETHDYVFLLSMEEADNYFGNSRDYVNKQRKVYNNGLFDAHREGHYLSNIHDVERVTTYNNAISSWWLRSPGYNNRTAIRVYCGGAVFVCGLFGRSEGGGVRPALWLNL